MGANMSARKVLVVMPFGGEDAVESRRSILNFKRLEYLIRNKCQVKPAAPQSPTDCVSYAVEVARTVQEKIPPWALDRIQTADIVVALVAGSNASVIYELAYRRTRGGELILVVDEEKNLPFYERLTGRCSWVQHDVLARIEKIAEDSIPDLPDFSAGIPDTLKTEIDRNDAKLAQDLQNALQAIESRFVPPHITAVQHLRGIVSEETASFYPTSIVEVSYLRHGEFDPDSPAIVLEFDDAFSRLFAYVDKAAANKDRPLTLAKLMAQIEKFSNPEDWKNLMEEQQCLTNTVIKEYGFALPSVPLRFNEKHRNEFRGKSYLPCLIAQVIEGNKNQPHKMFLLVVYIELPGPGKAAGPSHQPQQ
jgi:hypothetical protein